MRAVATMISGPAPHAVLLAGPDGVGKTTLALDLAAGLLCTAAVGDRPCRTCRACRMVDAGGHPDLHRLAPVGPGRQVVIGGPEARFRGIRDLATELALMPAEGGARVAIIEGAERMNEDAQAALLKTLEEPPPGVTIVLCADQEDRLLPTVRSRCFRLRLGLVGARDIEAIVADHGLADPPTAARLGRLAGGRPGLALAYARAPEAVLIRAELARVALDLTDMRPSARLAAARAAIPRAIALRATLDASDPSATPARRRSPPRWSLRSQSRSLRTTRATTDPPTTPMPTPRPPPRRPRPPSAGVPSSCCWACGPTWRATSSWPDAAVAGRSTTRSCSTRPPRSRPSSIPTPRPAFLGRVARGAELLATNVSPELLLDALVLAWPRRVAAA